MIFFKIAQKSTGFWAPFVSDFVAKNFQKSPNLVTLHTLNRRSSLRRRRRAKFALKKLFIKNFVRSTKKGERSTARCRQLSTIFLLDFKIFFCFNWFCVCRQSLWDEFELKRGQLVLPELTKLIFEKCISLKIGNVNEKKQIIFNLRLKSSFAPDNYENA